MWRGVESVRRPFYIKDEENFSHPRLMILSDITSVYRKPVEAFTAIAAAAANNDDDGNSKKDDDGYGDDKNIDDDTDDDDDDVENDDNDD